MPSYLELALAEPPFEFEPTPPGLVPLLIAELLHKFVEPPLGCELAEPHLELDLALLGFVPLLTSESPQGFDESPLEYEFVEPPLEFGFAPPEIVLG